MRIPLCHLAGFYKILSQIMPHYRSACKRISLLYKKKPARMWGGF
jgi:hypothetical protein